MAGRTPPRFVPTLTEVVQGTRTGAAASAGPSQDEVVRRVMQRIDLTLERRLREAVAATIVEQTRSLVPALRSEVEAVVREAVAQAFAEELEAHQRSRG